MFTVLACVLFSAGLRQVLEEVIAWVEGNFHWAATDVWVFFSEMFVDWCLRRRLLWRAIVVNVIICVIISAFDVNYLDVVCRAWVILYSSRKIGYSVKIFGFKFAHNGFSCLLADYKVLVLKSLWEEFVWNTIICSMALTLLRPRISWHEFGRWELRLKGCLKVWNNQRLPSPKPMMHIAYMYSSYFHKNL